MKWSQRYNKIKENDNYSRHSTLMIDSYFNCLNFTFPSFQGGFLPNVFKALSHRPAEFRAFFAYYNELMNKETGVSLLCFSLVVNVICLHFVSSMQTGFTGLHPVWLAALWGLACNPCQSGEVIRHADSIMQTASCLS